MGDWIINEIIRMLKISLQVIFWITKFLIGAGVRHRGSRQSKYNPKKLSSSNSEAPDMTAPIAVQAVVGKSSSWDPDNAIRLVSNLTTLSHFGLTITSTSTGIVWQVVVWHEGAIEIAQNAFASYYPGAEVTVEPYNFQPYAEFFRVVQPITQTVMYLAPILLPDDIKKSDPLAPLVNVMSNLLTGERVTFGMLVFPDQPEASKVGQKMITTSNMSGTEMLYDPLGAFSRVTSGAHKQDRYTPELAKVLNWKLSQMLSHVYLYLQIEALTPERVDVLGNAVLPQIVNFENERFNSLDIREIGSIVRVANTEQAFATDAVGYIARCLKGEDKTWAKFVNVFCAPEITTMWHLPHAGLTNPRIVWLDESTKYAPETVRNWRSGLKIGRNAGDMIYLPQDGRAEHMLIVGKSGSGKSVFMLNQIAQTIASGKGVMVTDPHGHLVRQILRHCVPRSRWDDVVVLDMGNRKNPPPFNPLRAIDGEDSEGVVNHMTALFASLYPDTSFRQMSDTLYNALLLIGQLPTPTLIDVTRLFDDDAFRGDLMERLDDFMVRDYWMRFVRLTNSQREELARPVLHRLGVFIKNRKLRAMACHPDVLDLGELMAQNKIILISMESDERAVPYEHRRVLGSLMISNIYMAALSGAIQNPPFTLYVDEAQHFVETDLPQMLSEARKYGLAVALAHQYLDQLSGDTLKAVEGNVTSIVAFEVGDKDARALLPYLKPSFTDADLVALGKYRAAVSTRYEDRRQPAFTIDTLPPIGDNLNGTGMNEAEREIRRRSIENYTPKTYSEVNAWLSQRYNNGNRPPVMDEVSDDFIDPV